MEDSMHRLLCLGIVAMLTTPVLSGEKDYNGRWAIYGTTERGQCARGFRLNVRVVRGKAHVIGYPFSGRKNAVSSQGNVNIQYVKGADVITINGMLQNRTGAGSWQYPTYRSTGRWRAERR